MVWNRTVPHLSDWYDDVHIFPELLSLPVFVSDTRFRQCGAEDAYLAVDEIESPCSIRRRRIRVSLTAISMSEA
jgi:hypothetical protein